MSRSRLRTSLKLGWLALAAPAVAEVVDVELVTVQVWVSDRDGRPVTGLSAADFTVLHDGDPVAISHFEEMRAGAPAPPAREPPAGVVAEAPLAAAGVRGPAPEQPHLVLYFDQLHLRSRDYPGLIDGIERLLAAGAVPAERVMVLR